MKIHLTLMQYTTLTCSTPKTVKTVLIDLGTHPVYGSILLEVPMETKNCSVPQNRSKMKMTGMRRRRVSTLTTRGSSRVLRT